MEDAGKSLGSLLQAQLLKLEAASGQRPESAEFGLFTDRLPSLGPSFTISGTSPSPPRSPVQTQPLHSRVETHGRRVTSWPPFGFRTDEEEEEERGWEGPSCSSDECVNGPTTVWHPPEKHQWLKGGFRTAPGRNQPLRFRSCGKIFIIRSPW